MDLPRAFTHELCCSPADLRAADRPVGQFRGGLAWVSRACRFSASRTVGGATPLGGVAPWPLKIDGQPHLGAGALDSQPSSDGQSASSRRRAASRQSVNGQAGLRGIECEAADAIQVEINVTT